MFHQKKASEISENFLLVKNIWAYSILLYSCVSVSVFVHPSINNGRSAETDLTSRQLICYSSGC